MTCKPIICFLLFITIFRIHAQDNIQSDVETPKIVTKLKLGDELVCNNIKVRFIDVENDSRCPKKVNCIRAGEAKVVFELYKNEMFIKKAIIEITPTTHLSNTLPDLYSSLEIKMSAYNLMPYPDVRSKIEKVDYFLQLIIID